MDKITLDGKRDFPITTNALLFMQNAYSELEKLAGLFGQNYILSGVNHSGGGVYTDGVVVLNGELMPFVGGTSAATVKVVTTSTDIPVGGYFRTEVTKYATFGSGVGSYNFAILSANRVSTKVQEVVFPINGWDMQTDASKTVDVSSVIDPAAMYILGYNVAIYLDDGTFFCDLNVGSANATPGLPILSGTNMVMYRFDSMSDYSIVNDGAVNRGFITIKYKNRL